MADRTPQSPVSDWGSGANVAIENWTNSWVPAPQSPVAEFVAKASDALGEAIPTVALAAATGGSGALLKGSTLSHAAGASNAFTTEMLEGSGDLGQAGIAFGTEWASEAIGGALFDKAASGISNKMLSAGVGSLGEGFEEVINGAAQSALTGESYGLGQALEDAMLGIAVGSAVQGGTSVANAVHSGLGTSNATTGTMSADNTTTEAQTTESPASAEGVSTFETEVDSGTEQITSFLDTEPFVPIPDLWSDFFNPTPQPTAYDGLATYGAKQATSVLEAEPSQNWQEQWQMADINESEMVELAERDADLYEFIESINQSVIESFNSLEQTAQSAAEAELTQTQSAAEQEVTATSNEVISTEPISLASISNVVSGSLTDSWTDTVEGREASTARNSAVPAESVSGVKSESDTSTELGSAVSIVPATEYSVTSTRDNESAVSTVSKLEMGASTLLGDEAAEATDEESAEANAEELASQIWSPLQVREDVETRMRRRREYPTYDFNVLQGSGSRGLIDETLGYKATFGNLTPNTAVSGLSSY